MVDQKHRRVIPKIWNFGELNVGKVDKKFITFVIKVMVLYDFIYNED